MTSIIERFGDFYALKNNWLSKESGINILIENKTQESYQWFIRNYKNYQNKLLVEWVFETINHTELLLAPKSNSKIKE